MEAPASLAKAVGDSGYAVARGVVSTEILEELRELCSRSPESLQARHRESLYGIRHLLTALPPLREIVASPPFIDLAFAILGSAARPVKGVFFDKTPTANWPVPWHQDVTITIQSPLEVPGFEMRPVRDGVTHAIPPVKVSAELLTLRIHLDAAGRDHGALRVIPGSHRLGRLTQEEVKKLLSQSAEEVVEVCAGDVMLMRPLLLHASSPCQCPGHRRVVHIEYSAADLQDGLQWAG